MKVVVDVQSSTLPKAEVVYKSDELSLSYRHDRPPRSPAAPVREAVDQAVGVRSRRDTLCVADTLVLAFAWEDGSLVALDAYTNKAALWQRTELAARDVAGTGIVRLVDTPAEDRIDTGKVPAYAFVEQSRLLEVRLSPRQATRHYRVSDRLVVGIDADEIATLYLEQVEIQ